MTPTPILLPASGKASASPTIRSVTGSPGAAGPGGFAPLLDAQIADRLRTAASPHALAASLPQGVPPACCDTLAGAIDGSSLPPAPPPTGFTLPPQPFTPTLPGVPVATPDSIDTRQAAPNPREAQRLPATGIEAALPAVAVANEPPIAASTTAGETAGAPLPDATSAAHSAVEVARSSIETATRPPVDGATLPSVAAGAGTDQSGVRSGPPLIDARPAPAVQLRRGVAEASPRLAAPLAADPNTIQTEPSGLHRTEPGALPAADGEAALQRLTERAGQQLSRVRLSGSSEPARLAVAADPTGPLTAAPLTSAADTRMPLQLATASHSLAMAPGQPGWDQAIGQRLMWMVGGDIQRAEIRVTPPELGPIHIRVSVDNDQTTVQFTAHHALTRDAIEQAIPRLREMFADAQLNLAQVEVGQRHASAGGDGGRGAGGDPAGRGADGGRGDGDGGREPRREPQWRDSNGLLDAYA